MKRNNFWSSVIRLPSSRQTCLNALTYVYTSLIYDRRSNLLSSLRSRSTSVNSFSIISINLLNYVWESKFESFAHSDCHQITALPVNLVTVNYAAVILLDTSDRVWLIHFLIVQYCVISKIQRFILCGVPSNGCGMSIFSLSTLSWFDYW